LIKAVVDEYEKAGYPGGKGNPKTPGDHLTGELASLVALHSYWDGKDVTNGPRSSLRLMRPRAI
jgi:hypothetical protein